MFWNSNTFGGTAEADFALGTVGASTLSGAGGADVLIGEADFNGGILVGAAFMSNARDLDDFNAFRWYSSENPLFFDNGATPHVSQLIYGAAGFPAYFSIFLTPGATLTVDIDYAGRPLEFKDVAIEILSPAGIVVATNDDVNIDVGGLGSIVANDPFLTFSAQQAGRYYIRIRPTDSTTFPTDSYHLLNVSLTGHSVFSSTITPGDDVLDGGANTDQLGGGPGSDVLLGGDGADWLMGGSGNDALIGGANADRLDGGTGSDSFRGTKAELNGDRITDLDPSDIIIIDDATLAGFTFSRTNNGGTFNYPGGSLTLGNAPTGLVAAFQAPGFGVMMRLASDDFVKDAGDFNGDGRADILWRNSRGDMSTWLATGAGGFASAWGTNVTTDWEVSGTGDFNGDGKSDLLWRNSNGALSSWQGASNGGFTPVWGTSVTTDWAIAVTGDFNGDGKDDIFWRNAGGSVSNWLGAANGGFAPAWGTALTADWKVVGAGDFNGDGRSDILWRNDNGSVATWAGVANGAFVAGWGTALSADWKVVGTGDFNGDGKDDVVWRNSATGSLAEWLGGASGGFAPGWGTTIAFDLHAVSTGDFNGDGREDIMWQTDSGQLSQWLGLPGGGGFVGNGGFAGSAPSGWQVQPDGFL
jgi:hypothetical protein